MNDPYVVLGVSRDATEQQIKDAYRELAKKYHPDNFADNPLSDLAEDKMKEINEAYDAKGAAAAAQKAATDAAAADAKTKADQALSDAKDYADELNSSLVAVSNDEIAALFAE